MKTFLDNLHLSTSCIYTDNVLSHENNNTTSLISFLGLNFDLNFSLTFSYHSSHVTHSYHDLNQNSPLILELQNYLLAS